MAAFSQTLKRLRQERRLSQQELADLIGVHVRQVSKYEMGTSLPTLERIRRMAEVLQVSADELVFGVTKRKAGAPRDPLSRPGRAAPEARCRGDA
ncbi:MAG: helix-turn-helix transcriptional regulator [Holophagales bacterium]|nr:helix-turn-helix transcriptional regulator [Holophagales bacterium]